MITVQHAPIVKVGTQPHSPFDYTMSKGLCT